MSFLYNSWYAVGWSEDFRDVPHRLKVLGQSVAIFRLSKGEVVAINDVCPHRFASLSDGVIIEDTLRCPYHGLQFDRSGQCVHNPHGDGMIPPGARVRAFPLVERHHALWIWMGSPEAANVSLIPDFSLYDRDDIASSRGYLSVATNYELVNDNLLDLSHAAFLHPFLTTSGFAGRTRTEVKQDGTTVRCMMWNDDEPITPLFSLVWNSAAERGDMRTHMHWTAPSNLLLDVGVTEVGAGPEAGPWLPSAHLLTPETENSTHYFWMVGRNCQQDNAELGQVIHDGIARAFTTEDEPMIVRVAENMAGRDFWSMRPAILPGDGAAIRARRLLAKMIRDENSMNLQAAE